MRIVLITGGARGGKSRYAQQRALALGGSAVTFIATARAGDDDEMVRRIERHRATRPADWTTIEAPRDAGQAVLAAQNDVIVLDCLNVLAANALADRAAASSEADALAAIDAETAGLIAAATSREGVLFMVTNEVGFGVHPPTALGRWFRDGLGNANQRVATIADEVVLMIAGVPVHVKNGASA